MKPPYYAVIFTSVRTEIEEGYAEMAQLMVDLAAKQEGFLGMESARNEVGSSTPLGVTVSYWKDLESIKKWKNNLEHQSAQIQGREKWYQSYTTRICLVEREYSFDKE